MRPSSALREALRAQAGKGRPGPREAAAARALHDLADSVRGVVFFGSRRTEASPDRFSAYDFFVVVRAYRPFYASLKSAGRVRRRPGLLAALNRVLTPSQLSLTLPDGAGGELHAKCAIVSLEDLARETSPSRRDHFIIGRLFQPSEVLFAEDEQVEDALLEALLSAHAETYRWVRPWLGDAFDAEDYCRTLLQVSMSREIRPEPTASRASALHRAQRAEQVPLYSLLLRDLLAEGELRVVGEGPTYSLVRRASAIERLRLQLYFQTSLVRATLRWFKHVLTFEDWLDYILRKVRRHVGEEIVLSPRERAWPLVFLWPRLFRYLRHKNDSVGRP
jgi:hypothetical protein